MLIEQRLIDICTSLSKALDGSAEIEAIVDRLEDPLRVAIAGREKAGKSTLVNALLRQRIARTDAGTCTRVVTWYRFGTQERVEVHLRDRTQRRTYPLLGGSIPADDVLGIDCADQVERLTVYLSNARLRELTIIDTPGFDSLSEEYSDQTGAFLNLGQAVPRLSDADAIVYLFPHPRQNDQLRLEELARLGATNVLGWSNVLGVLSRIDTLVGSPDPWPEASKVAARYNDALRSQVAAVVPVAGLLAESTCAGVVTDDDLFHLHTMTQADARSLRLSLLSGDRFLTSDECGLARGVRERLLRLFGLYGLREAVAIISATGSTSTAIEELRIRSGIDALEDALREELPHGTKLLKAQWAVRELERLVYTRLAADDPTTAALTLAQLEALVIDGRLWVLDVLSARARLAQLDESEFADLVKDLLSHSSMDVRGILASQRGEEIAPAALVDRWRTLEHCISDIGRREDVQTIIAWCLGASRRLSRTEVNNE